MQAPNGYAEILGFYGDPKFDGSPDAHVDTRWEEASMILVRSLPLIPKLYIHRLIQQPLRDAITEIAQTLQWAPKTIGCFQPRCKRGMSQVSIHTFGAAIDFDSDTNRMITCSGGDPRRIAADAKTIPDEVIAVFKKYGWTWGGDFRTRFDPMHFQYASGY